jgi:hypothetical protein
MTKRTQAALPLEGDPVEAAQALVAAQPQAVQIAPPDMTSPMGLMAYALQTGRTEALRDLVDLKLKIDADEARKAFARALVAFQAEAPALKRVKDGLRTSAGQVVSRYSPLDKTYATLRPLLKKHGFALRVELEPIDEGHVRVTHILTHEMGHEARSAVIAQREGTTLANPSQRLGGGITIAKRVTLKAVLGIEEEDEGGHFDEERGAAITEQEAATLRLWIDELGIDEAKMLDHLKVEGGLGAIPAAMLPRVQAIIERKRKEAGR